MSSQAGRDLLLKIGNGADPEVYTTIGAARMVSVTLNNDAVEATTMDSNGMQELQPLAGIQKMEVTLEGLFKDSAAEEMVRLSAFARTEKNYQLYFPNGDRLEASFIINDYHRYGSVEGLEEFRVHLARTGEVNFIAGV